MAEWEPAAWAAGAVIIAKALEVIYNRINTRSAGDATVQTKRIEDGAAMRGELWKRVEVLEARELESLKARATSDEEMRRIRLKEEDCQRRLKDFALEIAELRESVEKRRLAGHEERGV